MSDVVDFRAVRRHMLEQKIGVNELANRVDGLTKATVSRLSRQDSPVRIPTLARLAQALNVKPTELLKPAAQM